MLEQLRSDVCDANRELDRLGLIKLTWGNVSGIDREAGVMVIKPSGVPYAKLTPESMVVVDLRGGVAQGKLRPSSDAPTHAALYRAFPQIRGITHAHSRHATMFAQACHAIPCLGTTHADHFYGEVPLARMLTPEEVAADYTGNTGTVIIERLAGRNPMETPGILVSGHGPFTWGKSPADAVHNCMILEEIACMALGTLTLSPHTKPLPQYIADKHFLRKHGPGATYGQG